ncbi:hypothetical protein SteCoe_36945 [Stentor coeruleus]|uniref:EGF-like domain-containing protein n=1 Tax=Stentor coeruleus TaxID=5963 RepID=A0A1R2AP26_9CILI|nr:hypothetical protein SteCoe_36945 [Stentor coeruleus]
MIFNFEASDSDYCSNVSQLKYYCLVEKCPDTCVPSILINSISYCISDVKESNKLGTGEGCSNTCNGVGCFYDKNNCLNCNCVYGSCVLSSQNISQCWCPSDASSTSTSYGMPSSTVECICNDGFFNTTTLDSINACKPCNTDCAKCNSNDKCLSCKDKHAYISGSGCKCNDMYYNTTSLIEEDSCIPCNDECATCDKVDICLTCKDENAEPSNTGGCRCKDRYYKSTSVDDFNKCTHCNIDCATCENEYSCLTCIDDKAKVNFTSCACKDGYYALNTNPLYCSICNDSCLTCINNSTCISCLFEFSNIESGFCKCPLHSSASQKKCECDEGYYLVNLPNKPFSCEKCDKTCKSCNSSTFCLSCANSSDTITKTGECHVTCSSGYYYKDEICLSCLDLCNNCSDSLSCNSCVDNANMETSPLIKCLCDEGYEKNSRICEAKYFKAKISVNVKNRISIQFDEILKNDLIKENFEISIENIKSFTYSVKKKDFKIFYLLLQFIEDVKDGTRFNLTITKTPLRSKNGKILEKYIYSGNLHEYLTISKVIVAMANSTKAVTQVVVSSSLGSSVVSNPAAAWMIINTIQLISYIPLNSNPMPDGLDAFITGLGGYTEMIPNPFAYIFDSRTLSDPYLQARKFGTKTSVFWINIGPSMVTFLLILSMWPFLYFFSKFNLGKISIKIKKTLKNYRYNFFLRFWIQAYLDIGVASLIQLRSEVKIPGSGYFNQMSAVICIIIFILTPSCIVVCSFVGYFNIKNKDIEFFDKWGSLYCEFKNDKGFWSTQYYFVFLLRRLEFLLSQVYLNAHPYWQGGLNIFGSIVQTGFLIYYRPFDEKIMLFSAIIGEITTTLAIGLCFSFNFIESQKIVNFVEEVTIYTIIGGMGFQVGISIYATIVSFYLLWKKIEKIRVISFLKRAEVIKRQENFMDDKIITSHNN